MRRFLTLITLLILIPVLLAAAGCTTNPGGNGGNDGGKEDKTLLYGGAEVTVYAGPEDMDSSGLAKVTAAGEPLFVYETRVNHNRTWAARGETDLVPVTYFDFTGGTVEVTAEFPGEVMESVKITPADLGVTADIKDNTARFRLNRNGNYTVEINGDYKKALHIFAGEPDADAPDPDSLPANTYYYGPGVHDIDIKYLNSGDTVYIAGGAYVNGSFRGNALSNIKIYGRGIINGSEYERSSNNGTHKVPFDINNSAGLTVKGVIFLDPAGWCINSFNNDGILIEDIKIITARDNGDGISLQSCKNAVIRDCFLRTWDDALVVKNYNNRPTENISFNNITLWSDFAQGCEVGYETYGEYMRNIKFNNITLLHAFHKSPISLHNNDNALISDVEYTNFTIEDFRAGLGDAAGVGYLLDIAVTYNTTWRKYPDQTTRGKISGVTVENIKCAGKQEFTTNISSVGSGLVSSVRLKNITYNGTDITQKNQLNMLHNNVTLTSVSYAATQTAAGAEIQENAYDFSESPCVIVKR